MQKAQHQDALRFLFIWNTSLLRCSIGGASGDDPVRTEEHRHNDAPFAAETAEAKGKDDRIKKPPCKYLFHLLCTCVPNVIQFDKGADLHGKNRNIAYTP